MGFSRSVQIGPEFFAKAMNDYQNWKWAIAREFMQNCIDAPGCDHISVKLEDVGRDMAPWATRLTIENNGSPMSEDILTNKLLALGGSGKGCQGGAVGGFGKAKEILYFTHEEYEIVTGRLRVKGSGAGYDLTELEADDPTASIGTRSVVLLTDKLAGGLAKFFKRFITLSQWRGTFELEVIEGRGPHGEDPPAPTKEIIEDRLKKGQGRRNLGATETDEEGWGRVFTNKDIPEGAGNTVVVRIGGTPMFTRYTDFAGCVILELGGRSLDVLQSSRDALKYEFQNQLDEFCTDLVTNKRKALVDKRPVTERTRFSGYKLKGAVKPTPYLDVVLKAQQEAGVVSTPETGVLSGRFELTQPMITMGGKAYDPDSPQGHVAAALINMVKATADPSSATYAQLHGGAAPKPKRVLEIPLRPEFMLKNETGMKIPAYYTPDEFSTYSKGLIWRWMGVLVTLADLYGSTDPFSVGFIFTEEDTLAQYEELDNQRIIYIRPADVVRHEGKSPVIKARWSLTGGVIWDLVSIAAHEFTHYLGYDTHNEAYAAKLTEVMGVCLKERTRLAKVFQQRVEWPDTEKE